ncbi:MAG: hypothetical protein ACPL8I_11325, partial [Chloroflexaceae bacterium]
MGRYPTASVFVLVLILLVSFVPGAPPVGAAPRQPAGPPSLFGLNMYITGRERSDAEAAALVAMAARIGANWTREEICWACWGREAVNLFYDRRIGLLADAGIGIIGMLLTTPEQYRDPR